MVVTNLSLIICNIYLFTSLITIKNGCKSTHLDWYLERLRLTWSRLEIMRRSYEELQRDSSFPMADMSAQSAV